MRRVRTVNLEILRHGPPENQLLSPLTPYIGLSDGHEAATLHVPYDHAQFLIALNDLRYGLEESKTASEEHGLPLRRVRLEQVARRMSSMFSSVPGLISGLTNDDATCLTHLRLIFSANELAMLPFEMARSPAGFPGHGESLVTQQDAPLIMTREIRGAIGCRSAWPQEPKVLFVSAAPREYSQVPDRAHLLALTKALEPWTGLPDTNPERNAPMDKYRLSRYLTVLTQATLEDVAEACAKERFTHVHFLAHGDKLEHRHHLLEEFAIALMSARRDGTRDLVTADRLVSALGYECDDHTERLLPSVVTLATCDSAVPRGLLLPASGLAHRLHAAGVSLVVASQFPLTKRGSTTMVECLYEGLLQGKDPRVAMHKTRRRLKTMAVKNHDWASLVVYASLPSDLDARVVEARYRVVKHRHDAALNAIEREGEDKRAFERHFEWLENPDFEMPTTGEFAVEGHGMLASKEKRKAQLIFERALGEKAGTKERKREMKLARRALEAASHHYRLGSQAALTDADKGSGILHSHWTLSQWCHLDLLLTGYFDPARWYAAYLSASSAVETSPRAEKMWGLTTLIDLELTRRAARAEVEDPLSGRSLDEVLSDVLELTKPDDFARFATRRQLERYACFWGHPDFSEVDGLKEKQPDWAGLVEEAKALAKRIPWSSKYKRRFMEEEDEPEAPSGS